MKANFQAALAIAPQYKEAPFPDAEYEERLNRVRHLMEAFGVELLFLTSPESFYYVSGFQCEWYQAQSGRSFPPTSGIAVHVYHNKTIHFETPSEAMLVAIGSASKDVLDILVKKRKDKRAAARFIKKLMKGQGRSARQIVTDKLPSYGAARKAVMPISMHCSDRYANNRAEVSHEHTRAQERQMRRFKSPGQVQRLLAVHSQIHNLFRIGRHILRASNYRLLRNRSFETWQQVSCAY
jgi:putative transposase